MNDSYQQQFEERIETNATSQSTNPQYELKCPLRIPLYVNAIDLSLDPEFAYKGSIIIYNDNSIIYESKTKSLKNFSIFSIPLKDELLADHGKIKIFAWNGEDAQQIGLNVRIILSTENNYKGIGSKPLDKEIFNSVESEIDDIFPMRLYSDETIDKPLYMRGYTKLSILVNASAVRSPLILQTDFNGTNYIDNDLSTYSRIKLRYLEGTQTFEVITDFLTIKKRKYEALVKFTQTAFASINRNPSTGRMSYYLLISADGVNFVRNDDTTESRYCKLVVNVKWVKTHRRGDVGRGNLDLFEIYDSNLVGGNAQISFMVRGASGDLVEFISPKKFGTVSAGGALKKDISNITEDGTGRIGTYIPQLKDDLFVRLKISGNMQLSVRLIKVA